MLSSIVVSTAKITSSFIDLLQRNSLSLFQVLDLMKEVSEEKDIEEEGDGSDISGYHSDSESAVMTSGNSPFISKEARFSFLSRSGKTSNQSSPFKKGLQYERHWSISTTI